MDNRNIQVSLVGIGNVVDNPDAVRLLIDRIIGRQVVLKHELTNPKDPNAVCALFDGEKIGYLRSKDNVKYSIYKKIDASDGLGLLCRVMEFDKRYSSFTAEMEVDEDAAGEDAAAAFPAWTYSHVSFTIDDIPEWSRLDMLACSFKAFMLDGRCTAPICRLLSTSM